MSIAKIELDGLTHTHRLGNDQRTRVWFDTGDVAKDEVANLLGILLFIHHQAGNERGGCLLSLFS